MLLPGAPVSHATSPAAHIAPATQSTALLVKAGYSDEVYRQDVSGRYVHVTEPEYAALGYPPVTTVPTVPGTRYLRVPWSGSIYAVTPTGTVVWLDFEQWRVAGLPTPTTVAAVPGTRYVKTAVSATVYAVTPDRAVHAMSWEEFVGAGKPAVEIVAVVPGSQFVVCAYSPEVYAIAPDGSASPLTYAQWSEAGKPRPREVPAVPGTRYVRAPWSGSIYAVQPSGTAYWLTFAQWSAAGSPAATVVPAVPGTRYNQPPGRPDIYATTPDGNTHLLTYAEWTAAGSPVPNGTPTLGPLVKVPWSANVYELRSDGSGRWVDAAEYQDAGRPPVATVSSVPRFNDLIPAPSDGVYKLRGRGYGHGRGLSQWGSYQAAVQGEPWDRILSRYYPGTTRTSKPSGMIRVRLESDTGYDLIVRSEPNLRIEWTTESGSKQDVGAPADLDGCRPPWWRVRAVSSDLAVEYLCGDDWRVFRSTGEVDGDSPVTFRPQDGTVDTAVRGTSGFTRKSYRGDLQGRRSGSAVTVVNTLPVELYLRSVVPSEVPPSWPAEALRAQAVAARTYALNERASAGGWFDVYDSTRSQVYNGLRLYDDAWNVVRTYEDARTTSAVDATRDTHLMYGGAPAFTQFSSSNGGWTAQGNAPYLPVKSDAWDRAATANPYRDWTDSVSVSSLQSRFPDVGTLRHVRVTGRDGGGEWGGRITTLVIEGTSGAVTVTGDSAIRSALGTRSSYVTFE